LRSALADRYTVERELGRGGMATVYLADDLKHHRLVAIKVLKSELGAAVGPDRFLREIEFAARLTHPHILSLHDSGEAEGFLYYVMPFVEGESLRDRLTREKQLPIDAAQQIACEVADALSYAHSHDVVHRDIKPENILLEAGHAVVSDFGIARAITAAGGDKLTDTGIAVGTPAYMSPEQAAAEHSLDGRSDIYSLGCVLYEMLAGEPPFAGPSARAVLARHTLDPVPPLRTVRPTVSTSLERAIMKAMAKVPADRYTVAGEFKEAIRRIDMHDQTAPVRRRGRILAVLAACTLGIAALLWRLVVSSHGSLDVNRIMVYPLVVTGDFRGPRTLGEDVATMIGSALDGAGPLRWIDGWPLLDSEGRENVRTLTLARARSLARAHRCAYFMTGRVVARGESTDVFVELQDARGDSIVARGKATGLVTDAWRQGLRAVNGVLPKLILADAPDLAAEWQNRSPSAVASFLLGEAAFRRTHLEDALAHYRNAVKADSSFVLSAIRGAQAASWAHQASEATSLIEVATRQRMSPRYAHFARGYAAYLNGAADTAASEFRRTLALDPEMPTAWLQLGETYIHLLPSAGNPDSLAEVAFEEAHRLDPSATNVLFHLIEIRLRRGELARAEPLLRTFLAANPDTILARQVQIMAACVRTGPANVDWRNATEARPVVLLAAATALAGAGSQLPCAMEGFTALLHSDTLAQAGGRRFAALKGLHNLLVAQGRTAEAAARIDAAVARGDGGSSLYLLDAPLVPEFADRAQQVAHQDALQYGPNYTNCPYPSRLWLLGVWEAHAGRAEVVAAIARDLHQRALKDGSKTSRLIARSMAAHAVLARADTNEALKLLSALVSSSVPGGDLVWDHAAPLGGERLILARLLASRGQFQRAIEVASVFDSAWPSIYPLYLAASLNLRAEAAGALGDRELELRFRKRLAALRSGRPVASK
jgi:serine/threonine-protein kinase